MDQKGGDPPGPGNIIPPNCDHVVTGNRTDATAVLDGFTITAGYSDGPIDAAKNGAGMLNNAGTSALSNLLFTGNVSTRRGGGMFNDNGSRPNMTDVLFTANAAFSGGGMHNRESSPVLSRLSSIANLSTDTGGGMANVAESAPVISNTLFAGNRVINGGGLHNFESSPSFTNVIFTGNSLTGNVGEGGGVNNGPGSAPTLTNVTFANNHAPRMVGGCTMLLVAGRPLRTVSFGVIPMNQVTRSTHSFSSSAGEISVISDSLDQGGCPTDVVCTGALLTADPLFRDHRRSR